MWPVWRLVLGATVALGADFNTSVHLEVGGLSPICQLPGGYSYNETTGLLDRTYFGRSIWLQARFLGTAFNYTGSLLYTPGALDVHRSQPLATIRLGAEPIANATSQENASVDAIFGSMAGLKFAQHMVNGEIGLAVNSTINQFQFEVPVLTQASVTLSIGADMQTFFRGNGIGRASSRCVRKARGAFCHP